MLEARLLEQIVLLPRISSEDRAASYSAGGGERQDGEGGGKGVEPVGGGSRAEIEQCEDSLQRLAAENTRLRASVAATAAQQGVGGQGVADADQEALTAYRTAAERVLTAVTGNGETSGQGSEEGPSADLYTERDLQMHRLSDADIREEYTRCMGLYLDEEIPPKVRGVVEVMLMKLGELVDIPQVMAL